MSGWKQWSALEVVKATDFQNLIQDQVVQTYATTGARGSALGTAVSQGMVSYIPANGLEVYNGTSWVATTPGTVAFATNAGTAVFATNAGTAASFAGTIPATQVSGTAVTRADTATVTNPMLVNSQITLNGSAVALGGSLTISGTGFSNPMTNLGDLIVGGSAGVAQRLGIGSAGQYLLSTGSTATWSTVGTATTISGNIAPTQVTAGTFTAGNFTFGSALAVNGLLTANPAAPTDANAAKAVGYVGMPQIALTTGGTTISASMAGDHIYNTSAGTVTIPANSSVPLEIGTTVVIINGNNTSAINITTDTLRQAGTSNTGQRTLAAYGMATLVKVASTTWYISGNGIS